MRTGRVLHGWWLAEHLLLELLLEPPALLCILLLSFVSCHVFEM
jgi:hypothetical protein